MAAVMACCNLLALVVYVGWGRSGRHPASPRHAPIQPSPAVPLLQLLGSNMLTKPRRVRALIKLTHNRSPPGSFTLTSTVNVRNLWMS